MAQRPRSQSNLNLGTTRFPSILPTHSYPANPTHPSTFFASLRDVFSLRSLRSRQRFRLACFLLILLLFAWWNHTALGTLRRDTIYLLRPIWDTPPPPFTVIPHYAPPLLVNGDIDKTAWCGKHGWTARNAPKPTIVDAVLFSTELDLLEIRMREYKEHVDVFVIVESSSTFAGTPSDLHFADNRRRFEAILMGSGSRIVYSAVEGLTANLPKGSFENEYKMRMAVSDTLNSLRLAPGALIIQSDVDEIISKDTLDLLATCDIPQNLHLNMKNYRYGFNYPLKDEGYWRPHVTITDGGSVQYTHGRVGDTLLENSGWHCTFCFATLREMRAKMLGYSHNDRVRDERIAELGSIRRRVCEGRDPFNMWPVSVTLIWQKLPPRVATG